MCPPYDGSSKEEEEEEQYRRQIHLLIIQQNLFLKFLNKSGAKILQAGFRSLKFDLFYQPLSRFIPEVVQILVFQACLMPFYLHFIAFEFLHTQEFSRDRINAAYLVSKLCSVVQHTLDTQHVFFASFHYDNRL